MGDHDEGRTFWSYWTRRGMDVPDVFSDSGSHASRICTQHLTFFFGKANSI